MHNQCKSSLIIFGTILCFIGNANGTGPTFDINDPAGWELALVTNPTDIAAAPINTSKLV